MTPAPNVRPKVLFEDGALLVLDKPAGLVVHPAPSHTGPTLIDWVKEYLGDEAAVADFEEPDRLGLVHRLDKDTSGVIVVTKSAEAKTDVGRQFHDRQVQKEYLAFVEGIPARKKGIISAPIGRSRKVPTRMAVTGNGRPAETTFEVDETMKEVSLMHLYPKTGRTHQIRVHCAAIGHPIVGDRTYGSRQKWTTDFGIARPLLHAHKIELTHPSTKKRVTFTAPWPADMKKARTVFKRTFHALVISLCVMSAASAAPQKSTSSPAPKTSASTSSTGPSTASLKKDMTSLREQFKVLIEEVSALQDRVTALQKDFDEMSGPRRLRDLEKAISDLNGKAVTTSAVSEETKTQMLDLSRKVRAQEELLNQLRDQVDRIQRQVINSRNEVTTPQ